MAYQKIVDTLSEVDTGALLLSQLYIQASGRRGYCSLAQRHPADNWD